MARWSRHVDDLATVDVTDKSRARQAPPTHVTAVCRSDCVSRAVLSRKWIGVSGDDGLNVEVRARGAIVMRLSTSWTASGLLAVGGSGFCSAVELPHALRHMLQTDALIG